MKIFALSLAVLLVMMAGSVMLMQVVQPDRMVLLAMIAGPAAIAFFVWWVLRRGKPAKYELRDGWYENL